MVLPILEDLFAKTKQHRQIRCSGFYFCCSGVPRCSGVFGVPGFSGVLGCSAVPGFSTCQLDKYETKINNKQNVASSLINEFLLNNTPTLIQ